MGTYSHLTENELTALRAQYVVSLTARLTAPTSASNNGRSVAYQQSIRDIRGEIDAINAELAQRQGQAQRRPIYLV